MDLSLDTRNEGDWTVVAVRGEIDVYTAPKLREALVDSESEPERAPECRHRARPRIRRP